MLSSATVSSASASVTFDKPNRAPTSQHCSSRGCTARVLVGTTGQQLYNQPTNGVRLMLPRALRQTVRAFKAIWAFNVDRPRLTGTRSDDRYAPSPVTIREGVFDPRSNLPTQLLIPKILQLDRHSHTVHFIARGAAPGALKLEEALGVVRIVQGELRGNPSLGS